MARSSCAFPRSASLPRRSLSWSPLPEFCANVPPRKCKTAFYGHELKLVARESQTRRSRPAKAREQLLAPQVSRGKPGPANHWPEVAGMITRQSHIRNMGKPVEAGVAERRTGAVCESRDTILVTQLDTEHIHGSVQAR